MSTPPTSTRRERAREATRDEIKTIARKQMAEQGTAGISLRGIAAEMGMTATGLYRYYTNRDALLTELIFEAFNALADAVEAADAQQPAHDYPRRLLMALLAYREWAVTHPTDFQLIYGNPIPGYEAPRELTVPAASRNLASVVKIMVEAQIAGAWQPTIQPADIPANVMAYLETINVYNVPTILIYIGMIGWSRIHGMIMLEIFGHSPPVVGDSAAFYRREIISLIRELGMEITDE